MNPDVLRIGANIATLFGLVGFVCCLVLWAYLRTLKHKELQIESLPQAERAKAIDGRLSRYGLKADNLTREQKFDLLHSEMEKRYRMVRLFVIVLATVVVLCGLMAAVYHNTASWHPPGRNQATKDRLTGLLKLAHSEFADALLNLPFRLSMEKSVSSPMPPELPDSLSALKNDGEAFLLLSKPMQVHLPSFIKNLRSLTEGYRFGAALGEKASPTPQAGTVALMLRECSAQEMCIRLELAYQERRLNPEEHEKRFQAAMSYSALFLLTGLHFKTEPPVVPIPTESMTEEQLGAAAFFAGQELRECLRAVNATNSLDTKDAEKELNTLEQHLHMFGLPVDLRPLLAETPEDSERLGRVEQLLVNGLLANYGTRTASTFIFGKVFVPTMDTFRAYLTDLDFRKTSSGGMTGVINVGIPINSVINDVILADSLKKLWVSVYICTQVGEPKGVKMIDTWKRAVIDYYAHRLSSAKEQTSGVSQALP